MSRPDQNCTELLFLLSTEACLIQICALNAINRRESNVLESLFCRKCQIIHSQMLLCTEAWKRDKSGCRRSPYSRPRAFFCSPNLLSAPAVPILQREPRENWANEHAKGFRNWRWNIKIKYPDGISEAVRAEFSIFLRLLRVAAAFECALVPRRAPKHGKCRENRPLRPAIRGNNRANCAQTKIWI